MEINKNNEAAVEPERCECTVIHHDAVREVEENLPDEDALYDLAELFKVFGDSTRIRILSALLIREMCVCDIASLLNMTKSSISHQLRILKTAKLVRFRKSGKSVFYSLADSHVAKIMSQGLEHINE
ncbi:MAG: ArsR/SmtB family transcription factor [Acutalibacteraceae bacterium]